MLSADIDGSTILADDTLPSEPPTPPTRTSEKLRADLDAVNSQLASMKQQWDQERRKLLGDNAALQDATSRLNAEVRQAKTDIQRYAESEHTNEKVKADIQGVGYLPALFTVDTHRFFSGVEQDQAHGR